MPLATASVASLDLASLINLPFSFFFLVVQMESGGFAGFGICWDAALGLMAILYNHQSSPDQFFLFLIRPFTLMLACFHCLFLPPLHLSTLAFLHSF